MGIDLKSTFASPFNFMTPGVGAIHQDNGKPPIGAAPGIGTSSSGARFEQGLAGKGSSMFGVNLGAISADSYKAPQNGDVSIPGITQYKKDEVLAQMMAEPPNQGLAAANTGTTTNQPLTTMNTGVR